MTYIHIYAYISFNAYVIYIYIFHIIEGNHFRLPVLPTSALFSQQQVNNIVTIVTIIGIDSIG